MRWNSDKRCLLDLAGRGVAVVPPQFVAPGGHLRAEDFDQACGVVVKPAASAGATDIARYEPGRHADAVRHARMLLDQGRTAMVQPYQSLIEAGERAPVFCAGAFSHAIRKEPLLTEPGVIGRFRVPHPGAAPYRPAEQEVRAARAALAAVPSAQVPLFARVDLTPAEAREPVVMERELLGPPLFLGSDPQGLRRFVDAVAAEGRALSL
ncbi:hypothetical protein ACFWUZ_05055 [Streptomyces sp. NPDC058646]|uniref:hypothetical protein n=1 Tax=Streptomyces sp. NPDC058646 TaxID=3346574 RepID=UPI003646A34F